MALDYEIERQVDLLEAGGTVVQETRLWDPKQEITISMRGKEEAHDYRYFPDPDLVPIEPDEAWVEDIKSALPELPQRKRERFVREYSLPEYGSSVLVSSRALADYFEECVKHCSQPKTVSNWIMSEVLGILKRDNKGIDACPVRPAQLAQMLQLMEQGTISGKIAKQVFEEMYETGDAPEDIVQRMGLEQVSVESAIDSIIDQVLAANSDSVEKYQKGKKKVFGFLVGQVMKETKGKANPKIVNQILQEKLSQ
jgi:aspartyl-tRNA(Asn)/glutamyl-tRNA(Gln) amidotransferase subunit B